MKTLESQVREQEVHAQRVPISKKWEIALGSESLFHSFLAHSKRRGIRHSGSSHENEANAAMVVCLYRVQSKQDLYNCE